MALKVSWPPKYLSVAVFDQAQYFYLTKGSSWKRDGMSIDGRQRSASLVVCTLTARLLVLSALS